MPTDIPPITYGTFYHIYNRGNNHENIFIQERNYAYFLELWWKHVSPVADTCAYCLLRNHFHIVVYIKTREELVTNLTGLEDLSGFKKKIKQPSQYFSNFFNAYVRGINLAVQRTGALFERPFKRIPVGNESYLLQLIVYVHQNPQNINLCTIAVHDFRDWNYSSFHELTSDAHPLPSSPKYDIESLNVNKNLGIVFGGGARRAVGVAAMQTLSEFIRKFSP